jgi:membrane protease YdiL (CAAX protease family)
VLIVASLAGGKAAIVDIARRIFRWRVGIQWYALALLVPVVLVVVPAIIYWLFGGHVPVGVYMTPFGALIYAATFGPVSWLTEETAWRGFALPRLEAGRSALTASLILGLLWGVWHTPLFLIAGTGQSSWPYVGFLLFTLAESVLTTWIFNNTRGSVLLANIFHIASNITLAFSGILSGSIVLFWLGVAVYLVAAIIVVVVVGPARLSRAKVADDVAIAPADYVAVGH